MICESRKTARPDLPRYTWGFCGTGKKETLVNSRHTIWISGEFELRKSRRVRMKSFQKRTLAPGRLLFRQHVVCCQIKEFTKTRVRSLSAARQKNTAQAGTMERDRLKVDEFRALIGQPGRFKGTANCQRAGRGQ